MLYLASCGSSRPVTSHEIATHQSVPEPYLRQILAQLSKDGLIHSNRGPQGGHVLGRPPAKISLREILLSLEGHTTTIDQILSLPCHIEVGTEFCAIREVLLEVKQAIEEILRRTTLAVLLERQQRILERGVPVPLDLPRASSSLPIVDR